MRTLLLAVLFLAACDQAAAPPPPSPQKAAPASSAFIGGLVIRLNPIPGRPAAGYFTLKANEPGLRLQGVSSPSASRVELHETVSQSGMARMVPLDPATLNLSGPVAFEPGGKHVMLYDLQGLQPGGDAALLFTFRRASGEQVQVPATGTVQAAGGGDMGHMGH